MLWIKQSTATILKLGPFVDSTDAVTPETGLSIAQADIQISKNGGAFAQTSDASPTTTHDADGWYPIPLTATDTNTLGTIKVQVVVSGALPVWAECMVLSANVYDSLVSGSDALDVNTTQIGGSNAASVIQTSCGSAIIGYGLDHLVIKHTTIATLASQTSFTLSAGSPDDGAYNDMMIVVRNHLDDTQIAVGWVSDYVGSTKTVTLQSDPGVYTMAASNNLAIIAVPKQIPEILTDTNDLQTNQGNWLTATGFSTHSAADVWSVATRVVTAATNITSDGSAIATTAGVIDHVTLVDTTTTNTDMRGTDSAYTGTPPSAAAISAQVAADLATAHGAGSWQTATGFAVAGSAMTLTAAYDAAKTAAQAGDRMDLVDAPNATAVAAVQDGLSTFDASTDEVNLAADQSGVTVGAVNALAANSITSSVLATDCITSGKIATDAIGASELSTAAINAIQSGLATAANQVTILTNQTTIAEYIDTEVAAVKAVTDKLDDTLEDDLGTYRFTANALEQAPSGGGGGLTQQQVRDAMKLAPTAGDPAAGSVDAHLDDIIEDTGTTLPAAVSAIDAGTGSGDHSVTATVNDGTNPVQNARVTYKLNGMTVATGVTDDEGVAPAFSLDSATYTVVITASGYTFTSTTHAVSGDATPTYSMTAINITPSANADMTTVYFTARDISGNALAGESFSYRQVGNVTGSGNAFEVDAGTATSDADGLVFIAMYKGAAYLLYRGSGEPVTIRIASDAESTTELGNILI